MSDWTQTYIPYLSLFLSIISLTLYFYSIRYLPKKRATDQYIIQTIREIYPSLLSDLNESMEKWEKHYQIDMFVKLKEISKSGEIYFIKANHEELYENLIKIQDETVPLLDKVRARRHEYDDVRSKWREILLASSAKDKSDVLTVNAAIENFLNSFFNQGHYFGYLVAEDITRTTEIIESQIQDNLRTLDNYELLPEIVEVLLDTASESRVEMNILMGEIRNQFKEIIEDGAIPLLHDKIGKPI